MNKNYSIIVTLLLLLVFGFCTTGLASAQAAEDSDTLPGTQSFRRVAVLTFEGAGVSEDLVQRIRQAVEEALYMIDGFQMIEREQIDLVLSEQELQLSDLTNERSAVRVGQLLTADTVVTGSVNRFDRISYSVKFLDVETGEIVFVASQELGGEKEIGKSSDKIARGAERALFPDRYKPLILTPGFEAGVMLPIGGLRELVNWGIQSAAVFKLKNLLLNNLALGFEVQLNYYFGPPPSAADWLITVPILLTTEYTIPMGSKLLLSPTLALGIAPSILRYDPDGFVYGAEDPEYQNRATVYPEISGGVEIGMVFNRIFFDIGTDYTVIIGPGKPIMAFAFQLAIGYSWKEIR